MAELGVQDSSLTGLTVDETAGGSGGCFIEVVREGIPEEVIF